MKVTLDDLNKKAREDTWVADFFWSVLDKFTTLHVKMFGVLPSTVTYQEFIYNSIRDKVALGFVYADSGAVPLDVQITTDETKPDIQLGFLEIDLTITE